MPPNFDLTLACLRALHAEEPRHAREIVVVDNGSADGSADAIAAAFPRLTLLRNATNLGYAEGNNQGARAATGRVMVASSGSSLQTVRAIASPSETASGCVYAAPSGSSTCSPA